MTLLDKYLLDNNKAIDDYWPIPCLCPKDYGYEEESKCSEEQVYNMCYNDPEDNLKMCSLCWARIYNQNTTK